MNVNQPRHLPGQRGFTLVELVIVIMLMGVLAAWGSSIISDNFRTVKMVTATQTSADQVRYAVERLAREIREVKYVDPATGYAISSATATSMAFTRQINGSDVTVTINKSGSNLTLTYSSPAATSNVATQVSGFTMAFRTLANTDTTLNTDVRFVILTLTVTDAASGQQITEQTRVALRNA